MAACGRDKASAVNDGDETPPEMTAAGAASGGAPDVGLAGGTNEPDVAGQSGENGLGPAGGRTEGEAGGSAGGTASGGAGNGAAGASTDDEAGGGAGGAVASPSSIGLDDLGDYQVVQRVLGGSAQQVRITGVFSGSAIVSLQAQVVSFETGTIVIVPWTKLGTTSDAAYSGTLDVPQGGWYRTIVRGVDEDGREVARAAGVHRWGVGVNILCIGQSNMVGYGGNSYTEVGDLAGLYGNDRSWKHLADPYDGAGSASEVDFDDHPGASMVPALVNALSGYFPGLPIGVIPAAKGSSPLACAGSALCWGHRNEDDPADASSLYGNSLAKARSVGGVELIVMHQGETDATNSTPRTTYAAELALLAQNYRADLAGDVPLFMCQLGRSTTDIASKHRTDTSMQAIRSAQHDSDDPPRIYLAATAVDLDVDGTDHYPKPTLDELGRRIAGAIAYHYRVAGAPSAYRGPEIASVSYAGANRAVVDVHLKHRGGTDFAPAANINGFVVLDGSAPVPLTSVVRRDAATIRITLRNAIGGIGSVRYLYGKLPFQKLSGTVRDNSSLALPLEPTTSDLLLP